MQRLVDEAGVSAVLSLQSDLCLEALEIDWEGLVRPAGAGLGVLMHRVGVRDFDRLDQAAMLPVAVRALAALCRACDGRAEWQRRRETDARRTRCCRGARHDSRHL